VTIPLTDLAAHLDALLRIEDVPDYPNALNGVQVSHRGPVRSIATAVDASAATIQGAVAADANLLLVHHGLFWGGTQPLIGHRYERIQALLNNDVAVYSAHLPLDAHDVYGNSRLLAAELGLRVTAGFAQFQGVACGVRGDADDLRTSELLSKVDAFAQHHGHRVVASPFSRDRRTRHWAICSGAGAGAATLDEASLFGVDTLIVGEGPHWSAVEAPERGLTIIYAGHYATEALGVMALGAHLASTFALPHQFITAPTGL